MAKPNQSPIFGAEPGAEHEARAQTTSKASIAKGVLGVLTEKQPKEDDHMTKCLLLFLLFTAVLAVPAWGEEKPLTNEDIVKMVRADMGSELVVNMIANSECNFETGGHADS